MPEEIDIASIIVDERTQMRVGDMDEETVLDYQEAIQDGKIFPPVIVYGDKNQSYLADGHYRLAAEKEIGCKTTLAEVRKGGLRESILHACGANAEHGKPRTRADKRKAVETMLADAEWATWSNRAIAESCKVSHPFVEKMRTRKPEAGNVTTQEITLTPEPQSEKRADGQEETAPTPPRDNFKPGYLDSLIDLLEEASKLAEALEENEILFDINGAIKIAKKKNRE